MHIRAKCAAQIHYESARAGKHAHFLSTCTYQMSSSRSTDHDHELSRSDGEPVLCMDSVTSNMLSSTYSEE